MKSAKTILACSILSLTLLVGIAFAQSAPATPSTQPSGTTTMRTGPLGVPVEESKGLAKGWSIKKDILDKAVYNEANEKIGTVEDIVVTPEKGVAYAVIGTGGFLGMAKHDVAIPVQQFKIMDKRIHLAGATKDALKNLPEFKYVD